MVGRSFSEHLANLEDLDRAEPGDRLRVTLSGRTGVLVDKGRRHTGWLIRWDEPVFGVIESRVTPSSLERV